MSGYADDIEALAATADSKSENVVVDDARQLQTRYSQDLREVLNRHPDLTSNHPDLLTSDGRFCPGNSSSNAALESYRENRTPMDRAIRDGAAEVGSIIGSYWWLIILAIVVLGLVGAAGSGGPDRGGPTGSRTRGNCSGCGGTGKYLSTRPSVEDCPGCGGTGWAR